MTVSANKTHAKRVSVAAFSAAYAAAIQFTDSHKYEFVDGGVDHSFMSFNFDFIPLVQVTTGAKIKVSRKLSEVPVLSAERFFKESFAGEKDIGWASSRFKVKCRSALEPIFSFIARNPQSLMVKMAEYECDTSGAMVFEMYIQTTDTSAQNTVRMHVEIHAVDVVKLSNDRLF